MNGKGRAGSQAPLRRFESARRRHRPRAAGGDRELVGGPDAPGRRRGVHGAEATGTAAARPVSLPTRRLGPGGDNGWWTGRVGRGRADMCLRTRPGLRPAMNGPARSPAHRTAAEAPRPPTQSPGETARARALRDASSVTQRQLAGEATPCSVRRRPEPGSVPGPERAEAGRLASARCSSAGARPARVAPPSGDAGRPVFAT